MTALDRAVDQQEMAARVGATDAPGAVIRARAEVDEAMQTAARLTLATLGIVALLTVVIVIFMARRVVRPLKMIENAAAKLAAGDFSPLPTVSGRHEVAAFSAALNTTMQELEALWAKTRKCASIGLLTRALAEEAEAPLQTIGSTVETLAEQERALSPEERRVAYRELQEEVERARRVVRHLLFFSGMRERPHETLAISEIIEAVLNLTRNHLSVGGVTLALALPADLPKVRGDRLQLEQVFLNFILNAVRAMPEGGEITVRARAADDPQMLRIDVVDTGIGIREEHLATLLNPAPLPGEPHEGMALGLSVSSGIVRRHGGRVAVQSTFGLGSTFTVFLPAAPASEQAA